jgi:hypothetical protein
LSGRLKNMDIPEEERFFDQWETEYYTNGSNTKRVIRAHSHYNVELNKEMFQKLSEMVGTSNIYYTIGEELKRLTG